MVHPAFGDAGATCDGAALACAGELACTAASCAVPGAATAVCQASAAPAWSGDLANLPVPAGDASAVAGTCWPLDAAGAVAHRIVVEAAAGEHLEVALPPGATAMLRVDCAAPASEMICLDASGGLDLEAGAYELLVAGIRPRLGRGGDPADTYGAVGDPKGAPSPCLPEADSGTTFGDPAPGRAAVARALEEVEDVESTEVRRHPGAPAGVHGL